jgi:manganese/iron transport system permease protein
MIEDLWLFRETLAAAILAGVGCSVIGVFIFCLRIPFVGVLISHAALAGAILAHFLGIPETPAALGTSLLAVFLIGPLSDRTEMDLNLSLSILFSLMMGLAFLGIGLIPEPKTHLLGLLWGNILLVTGKEVLSIGVATLAALGVLGMGFKEFKAILFSRTIAASLGIWEPFFFYSLLVLCGVVVSVNLQGLGGLMIYSLLVIPAAAAYQFSYSLKRMMLVAALLGIGASLAGFLFSYLWSLPTGASIVIFSSLEFALCVLFSPKRRKVFQGGVYG